MEIINILMGKGEELNSLQMTIRTILVFFTALLLLRVAGIRTFGKKTAFDMVIIIMLGAVLSRAIVGASPFIPTIIASLAMVLIHRLLGILSYHSDFIGKLVKGDKKSLYKNGMPDKANMRSVQISHKDVMEEIRLKLNQDNLQDVEEIFIERTGKISIIKQSKNKT